MTMSQLLVAMMCLAKVVTVDGLSLGQTRAHLSDTRDTVRVRGHIFSDEDFGGDASVGRRGPDDEKDGGETAEDYTAWNDRALAPDANDAPVLASDFGMDYVNWSMCNVAYHSNLGGVGPDVGEQSLRYYRVGKAGGGQGVDLVVTANSHYKAHNINLNGLTKGHGCFGEVNVASDEDGINYVNLLFSLYLTGTNTSVAFDRFYFTLYDMDSSNSANESITFYNKVNQLYFYPTHELEMSGNLSTGLTFTSTAYGTGSDNPKDPRKLTEFQKERSVMVDYVEKTQWKITFTVQGGRGGRNFVFAGRSNVDETPAPTPPTPLPTPSPTPENRQETTTLASKKTTTTTTCDPQTCQVFADPHVSGFDNSDNQGPGYLALFGEKNMDSMGYTVGSRSFDGRPVDLNAYDAGDFWLVKSETVHIQARFRLSGEFIPDKAAIGAVAVGGPFLNGNTLIVEPLDGNVAFNAVPLSSEDWSDAVNGVIVHQSADGDVDVAFPMGVKLLVKRLAKHVDVKITMPKIPGDMDGECGNYDGIPENDEQADVMGRMGDLRVEDNMLLFDKSADPL